MKDNVSTALYACEGFIITYAGYHVMEQVIIPILVACVGAVLTVLIQHHLKKYLSKRDQNTKRYSQNGKK